MNIQELADKYIELARENVNIKKIFPPNKYTFTTKYFRPIKGWDTEWYDTMRGWERVLESIGWKEYWYDRDWGEAAWGNIQYFYDSELPSCSTAFSLEIHNKITNWAELSGDKCNQICFGGEEFYKLSNPPSTPYRGNG